MKIAFMEDKSCAAKEHEINAKEIEAIFKIAENLSDKDLYKIAFMCKRLDINENQEVDENDQ